ncbi:MAG: hypothetical protein ACMXYG_06100 [Candidatus Woesearchaeota archaeon]
MITYFKQLLTVFKNFKDKKFYFTYGLDIIFLLIVLQIGNFAESASSRIISMSSAFNITIIIFLGIFFAYSILKYFFLRIINIEKSFITILWKHGLAFLVIFIILFLLAVLPTWIINNVFIETSQPYLRIGLVVFLFLLGYLSFLNYQPYTNKKFWFSLWKGFKDIKKKLLIIIGSNFLIVLVAYLLSNIILLFFKIFSTTHEAYYIYETLNSIIIFLTLACWLTLNKMIVFKK